jgi:hypothetical protein
MVVVGNYKINILKREDRNSNISRENFNSFSNGNDMFVNIYKLLC